MSGCGRQFSREKTFADSPKTTKFAKVFSLESFPIYGSVPPTQVNYCTRTYNTIRIMHVTEHARLNN